MKKRYITLSMALLFSAMYGQDKTTEKADKLFQSYQYAGAIEQYSKLAEGKNASEYVYKQLADSYYAIFDADNASKWYAKAVAGKTATAETYYRYAQTLKGKAKYKEAAKQMDAFCNLAPNDARAKAYKTNPDYIANLTAKSKMFNVAEINIKHDEKQSDFGAFLTNDNIFYFVSNKNGSKKTDTWTEEPTLDIYQSTRSSDGSLTDPMGVKELNTPYHDGPVTISADGKIMFFARDLQNEKKFDLKKVSKNEFKVGKQGLYKATKVDGKWAQIEALPFNSINYSVSNPSLSKDGKTLYFASDMPGGIGANDIWKVSIEGNSYGKPQNLGPQINTTERETFPFIDTDDVLYYASSGLLGLGGLDIYKVDLKAGGEPQNVGKPVNSEKDDFSFSYNKTLDVGYFSSNRKGSDMIYTAKPVCDAQAIAMVTNKKTGAPLANAQVTILDAKKRIIDTKQTDAQGRVAFDIVCQTAYSIQAKAADYSTAAFPVEPVKTSGETVIKAPLAPVEVVITETEIILNAIYFEFNKSDITPQGAVELDKLVQVMEDHPTFVIFVKSHTDSKGKLDYNLKLSERRAQSTVDYLVSKGISKERVSGKGFGSLEPKIKCGANCTDEENSQNRRSEFLIVKR
jgi:outer membrane protein OmpA-like peptidoglycan-associated protein